MTDNPRRRNLARTSAHATQPARLPGLIKPRTGDAAMDRWIDGVHETIQVREGRGSQFERTVTHRDLVALGIITSDQATNPRPAIGPQTPGLALAGGGVITFDDFSQKLLNTKLYRDLVKRIDDPSRFDGLPEKTKALLLDDLSKIDGKVDAYVRRTEESVSNSREAFAQEVTEIRSSVARAASGVRSVKWASASANRATAGIVEQVTARLDGFDGGVASVETVMSAIADRATGLEAQYTMKVNAGGAFAAIGLGASSPVAGVGDSHIIFVADNFAFVHPDDVIGTGPGEIDPTNPGSARIPFGIDGSGVIYLNGEVRINALGSTLNDLAAATGIYVTYTSGFWKVDSAGAAVNTSITFTANLTAGLSGFVDWSKSGTGTTPPTAGTTNTWVIDAADQTDDAVTYTATLVDGAITYEDSVTIVRLRDGASTITGMLTNESHTVPASDTGVVASFAGAGGTFKVFQGSTDVTTLATFAIQTNSDGLTASINASTGVYSVTAAGSWASASRTTTITFRATYGGVTRDKVFSLTKALTGTTGLDGDDAQLLTLGYTGFAFVYADATATTSPGPTITLSAILTNVSGTATFTATAYNAAGASLGTITLGGTGNTRTLTSTQFNSLGATTTRTVVVTATLGSLSDTMTVYRGDNGTDTLGAVLSNEAVNVPADSAGAVSSFSAATTTIKVYKGITDDTANWTFSRSDSSITTTINAGAGPVSGTGSVTIAATALSADVGTCTITASRTGFASISKSFTVTKSKAGATGTGTPGLDGARGSLRGAGTNYGLYLSGTSDSTDPWPTTSTNKYRANRVISNMLNGSSSTSDLVSTSLNMIGDEVTLTNAAGTAVQVRYWDGTAWKKPNVKIDGSLLVTGSVAAAAINTTSLSAISATIGTITGETIFKGSSTYGSADACIIVNEDRTEDTGIRVSGAITGISAFSPHAAGAAVNALASGSNGKAVYGQATGSAAIGVHGISNSTSGVGVKAENTNGALGEALTVIGTASFTQQITVSKATGTAPFAITSTTKVNNLNADLLDGFDSGNGTGKIPINNGTVNTNLNADMLDGKHASQLCDIFVTNVGTATVAGGINLLCTVASVETAGSGNTVTIRSISDRRRKKLIRDEALGLEFIQRLRPVTYRMKGKGGKMTYHGFIAQEVEELLGTERADSLAQTHADGMKGTDYMSLIAPLVKAVQEIDAKLDKLASGVAS